MSPTSRDHQRRIGKREPWEPIIILDRFDLFADSHVHIYPFMSVQILLEAARRNLFEGRGQAPGRERGLLLIADPEGVRGLERPVHHKRVHRLSRFGGSPAAIIPFF